ncbi:MAG: hypothetical protein ABI692_04735 [Terracoccus sp.]
MIRVRPRKAAALLAGLLTAAVILVAPPAATAATAATTTTLIGASSVNFAWFDPAVGPMQIYRDFDNGFSYPTWQDTPAYQAHPNARANHYSMKILPQRLLDPTDTINASLRAFIATTPKNIILTNYHEPDDTSPGRFTPAQFRAGIVKFAGMVRAQNAVDGGARRTSVVLMNISFKSQWTWPVSDWWPTDARDGGHVDLIAADVYAMPHATLTACCPRGYTDGVNWQQASRLLSFIITFAKANKTPWAVAELGYLEDIHDPSRKALALRDAVNVARANGADHISYFDASGPRADWRLRWSSPVGSTPKTSQAALMWKSLANGG